MKKWFSLAFAIISGICAVLSVWFIVDDYVNEKSIRWLNVFRVFLFTYFCWSNTLSFLEKRKQV